MTDDFWKLGWRALFTAFGAAAYLVLDALEKAGILSPPMAALFSGCALMRGIPVLSPFLARRMPAGAAVPAFERNWMALVMTGQILAGIILGVGVQYLIVWGVFGQILPAIGLHIFDYAGEFVDYDLPGRVIALFTHKP